MLALWKFTTDVIAVFDSRLGSTVRSMAHEVATRGGPAVYMCRRGRLSCSKHTEHAIIQTLAVVLWGCSHAPSTTMTSILRMLTFLPDVKQKKKIKKMTMITSTDDDPLALQETAISCVKDIERMAENMRVCSTLVQFACVGPGHHARGSGSVSSARSSSSGWTSSSSSTTNSRTSSTRSQYNTNSGSSSSSSHRFGNRTGSSSSDGDDAKVDNVCFVIPTVNGEYINRLARFNKRHETRWVSRRLCSLLSRICVSVFFSSVCLPDTLARWKPTCMCVYISCTFLFVTLIGYPIHISEVNWFY